MRFWWLLALCVALYHVSPPESPDALTLRCAAFLLRCVSSLVCFVAFLVCGVALLLSCVSFLLCRVAFLLRWVGLCVWFARARVYTRFCVYIPKYSIFRM